MKSEKRRKLFASKRARKGAAYREGKGKSRYARKARWLREHGGEWGFNVSSPKPWR
jgi:hypothetical protein